MFAMKPCVGLYISGILTEDFDSIAKTIQTFSAALKTSQQHLTTGLKILLMIRETVKSEQLAKPALFRASTNLFSESSLMQSPVRMHPPHCMAIMMFMVTLLWVIFPVSPCQTM